VGYYFDVWFDEVVVGVGEEVGLLVDLVRIDPLNETFLLRLNTSIVFIRVLEHVMLEFKLFLDPTELNAPFVRTL